MPNPLPASLDRIPDGGLSTAEARARLRSEGPNLLPRPEKRTPLGIVLQVLREPMFALLLGAGAVYLILGELSEALILFLFACTSVGIAIVQEVRTERVLDSLRDLTSPRALVIRDGREVRIAGADLVRGDLVLLAEGDRVPADAVLLAAHDLATDESLLTGEAVPVRKVASTAGAAQGRPGGDDLPLVFAGSLVVRGRGRAVVTATGLRSEIGRIGSAIAGIETEPPRLRRETRRLVRGFALVSLSLAALVVPLYGLLRGNWLEAVLSGIALGMSMLPEEFPLVLTVFMVMGAWRISKARVLTRQVAAIETLGAATVLCTDKTGTLTQNRMTIVALHPAGTDPAWQAGDGAPAGAAAGLLRHGILACARDAYDPMEKAFHALGREQPHDHGAAAATGLVPVQEYGLRADLLAVTHVWQRADGLGLLAATKGAPEAVATLCGLPPAEHAGLAAIVDAMAARGMRVLGVAVADLPPGAILPGTARGLPFRFLGLVGLADPLRPTVPDAVRECRSAGIRVLMITGDYPATARAIAEQAGLAPGAVVTGADLDAMDDAALAACVRQATVFARTMPEQKLRIVQALKANGEVVAMTGDGVNDAPSLKAAHIGIAMGGRGTDVAREASSLVLLDDDFAAIVDAVRLGRRIYDNLRKAMAYIFAVHVPIAGLALLPLVLGLPLILWPLHIAFLELVIDPMCSIVFEAETEEGDIMSRPPRAADQALFGAGQVGWAVLQGLLVLALVASLFILALDSGQPETEARTLAFATLVVANLGLVLVNRARGSSLRTAFRRRNRALWAVSAATFAILALVIAVPAVRDLFHFGPLHPDDIAVALGAGGAILLLLEALKRRFGGVPAGPAIRP
ncbi:cation-translocating P-type ATPase [Zavarzinia sp. CC-PAN008]|uniref:cation-translocating P-type ATPase n=1 Tax=Zavarzinia sp. CC-PAN008 TaxID=3243332 RepID=UPI003F744B57